MLRRINNAFVIVMREHEAWPRRALRTPGVGGVADVAAAPAKRRREVSLEGGWTRHAEEVRDAQRLRWRVFADEMWGLAWRRRRARPRESTSTASTHIANA